MLEDPDEGHKEARAALHAAKRARRTGSLSDAAMLNAMEAAEKQHESKSADSRAQRNPAVSLTHQLAGWIFNSSLLCGLLMSLWHSTASCHVWLTPMD